MTYRVELTQRAVGDLRRIYQIIDAENAALAALWFNGLETSVLSLDEHPARGAVVTEDGGLRQLLYGRRRNLYRIIYAIDDANRIVTVLHIRHGARDAFMPNDRDDDA
jgi:plasmid stabilization system protein ParE